MPQKFNEKNSREYFHFGLVTFIFKMWILKFFSFFFVFFAIGLCHEELQEFEDLEFTNFTLNFFNELISDVNQR